MRFRKGGRGQDITKLGTLAATLVLLLHPYMTQTARMPDLAAQRAAMAKLNFLIGNWSGDARMFRSGSEPLELVQTESAEYKLDGLLLEINGVGRTKSNGTLALQAFGIISYEDDRQAYHFRAFNDGRWLETDVQLADDGKGISWGFRVGEIRTSSIMRIAANGNWTEDHDITVGTQPARKLMEVDVSRQPPK